MLLICAGREWSLDVDYGSATAETGAAYLAMLSIDTIHWGCLTSIEKLTDMATEGSPGSPGKQNGAPVWMPVEREHCTALDRGLLAHHPGHAEPAAEPGPAGRPLLCSC